MSSSKDDRLKVTLGHLSAPNRSVEVEHSSLRLFLDSGESDELPDRLLRYLDEMVEKIEHEGAAEAIVLIRIVPGEPANA